MNSVIISMRSTHDSVVPKRLPVTVIRTTLSVAGLELAPIDVSRFLLAMTRRIRQRRDNPSTSGPKDDLSYT